MSWAFWKRWSRRSTDDFAAEIESHIAMEAERLMRAGMGAVSPRDPVVFVVCALVLLIVAIVACAAPMRRALRVDPIVALRAD